jgi:hypothetical protein
MRSKLLYIFLSIALATVSGCASHRLFNNKASFVAYQGLEGMSSVGEGGSQIQTYPTQVGGVELAKFDTSVLTPKQAKSCAVLTELAGQEATCDYLGDCRSVVKTYQDAYGSCIWGIKKHLEEQASVIRRADYQKKSLALTASNKKNAHAVIKKYAKDNNLSEKVKKSLKLIEQPKSLEEIVRLIMKGDIPANTYFYASCCDGYKVAQPTGEGYRLTTKNYKGLPILLETEATMFEGNKAGRGLGWVRYDGVTKYTTTLGASTQALKMTKLVL